jgi:subtilisin family serine protease
VRADVAWSTYAGDPSAVVAIIDSGVDLDHPDLDEHFAWGSDPWAGDADPTDTDGHGTHCAGIAAAVTDNGVGVAGAAPGCRFAAYRCGTSSFPTSALVAAINDAVARGARVLSMSWGSSYDDPAIRKALKAAAAQGCVLVAAAGNDDSTAAFYPAAHPFVIAVGASTPTDARASFSNWGSWVDLAAPGQSILSTYKDGQYKVLSGTSMACPLVAGAATLLYARLGERSTVHAAQVRAALEGSGVPIGSWVAHGRLDMAAAMSLLFPPGPPQVLAFGPTEVPALHGAQLTLTGLDLLGTTAVTLGGQPASFQVLSDSTLHVQSPDAPTLGPAQLLVTTPLGTTGLDFNWVATSPPQLLAAATATAGAPFSWSFGGAPGETSFLLLSLQPDTITWNDATLLAVPALIVGGQLDAVGLGGLTLVLPAGSAGLSFRSQLATWNGALSGVTPVATTTIQ